MEKKIKNISKVCTSSTCASKQFPYCAEWCLSAVLKVAYEGDKQNE